jgi:CBS-domain-containing membrane protein
LLAKQRISAVPVVGDSGAPIGVVSEADLLARFRDPQHALFAGHHAKDESRKAKALLARDLLTAPVVTIEARASLAAAAIRLAGKDVRRLFVVEDTKLVGVVSRRDLLSTFRRPDEEIRGEIERAGALSSEVPGVVDVRNRLDFVWDDDVVRPASLRI